MAESAKTPGPAQEGGGFKCSSCGGSQKIKDHGSGEIICATCGCVVEEKSFDRGLEWRAFFSGHSELPFFPSDSLLRKLYRVVSHFFRMGEVVLQRPERVL